jgi:plasmid stabilization system protein ParE
MNLALDRAAFFIHDFEQQAGWYVREASVEVARRYLQALDATLQLLRVQPGLGPNQALSPSSAKRHSVISR